MELNLEIPGVYIIYGKAGCGKTHLTRYIMQENYNKFATGLIFTTTPDQFDYADKEHIREHYSEEALSKLLEDTKNQLAAGTPPPKFVIFDNCALANSRQPFRAIDQLVTFARHLNVMVIITTLTPQLVPPQIRNMATRYFTFYTEDEHALEILYNDFGRYAAETLGSFKVSYIDPVNFEHRFLMIDYTKRGTGSCAVMMCPPEQPKFHLRCDRNTIDHLQQQLAKINAPFPTTTIQRAAIAALVFTAIGVGIHLMRR